MTNKQRIDKKDLIIKTFLIAVIILLLVHNCYLLKDKNKESNPTGNVNIIEFICDKDDVCVEEEDNNNNQDYFSTNNNIKPNSSKNNSTSLPIGDKDDDEVEETEFLVKDKTINWETTAQAKIFTNSMYELDDKIAPESSNTYQFVIKNGTNYTMNYVIDFIETNPYNINMKYKLKKNDTYLIDHYVSAGELSQTNLTLNSKKNDTYYLEWKWISSDNDTQIGETPNAEYELKIEVKAESNND